MRRMGRMGRMGRILIRMRRISEISKLVRIYRDGAVYRMSHNRGGGRMKTVSMRDYTYDLADDRIARYPLPQRDRSKLLVYRQGQIEHTVFNRVGEHLPP